MEVVLKDLLECYFFKESAVLAGNTGVGNLVRSVTVMDSPDAYKYMKGGDLVVSSAYFFIGKPDLQETIVKNLAKNGAAGLAIMRRYIGDTLPQAMKEAADCHGFPIVSMPDSYAYTDIYEFIKYNLISRVTREVAREDRVIQEINDAGHDKGLQGIADTLYKWTGFPVAVFHDNHRILNKSHMLPDEFPDDPGQWKHDHIRREGMQEIRCYKLDDPANALRWVEYPLISKGQVEGRLLMFIQHRAAVREDFLLLEVAAKACIAELKRLHNLVIMQRNYKSEFLRRFFFGDLTWEDAMMQAKERDIVLPVSGLAVLVDTQALISTEKDVDSLNEMLEKIIIQVFGQNVLFGMLSSQKIALYVNYSKSIYSNQIDLLYERLVKTYPREVINIGVGRPADLNTIQRSYQEAEAAIAVGACMGFTRQVYHFGELGFFRLLKLPDVSPELVQYCRDYLEPILSFNKDGEKNTDLISTLQNYVECCYNYRETGRRMFLHPNTVRYRIGVIEKLCRVDFEQFFDRLNMEIALKIYPLIQQMRLDEELS